MRSTPDQHDPDWPLYPETVLHFATNPPISIDLRAIPSAEALDRLESAGFGNPFAVLTAFDPRGENLSRQENEIRRRDLEMRLAGSGNRFVDVDACSPDRTHCECSVAVIMVDEALQVSSAASFTQWIDDATKRTQRARAKMDEWQQFVVRVVDERGDAVPDYNIQLFRRGTGTGPRDSIHQFDVDVHTYKSDSSLRCFHVRLADLDYKKLPNLWIRVIASSGSQLVGYQGFGSEKATESPAVQREGKWDATLDLSSLADDTGIKFFYPFTTTLIELKLNREPLPLTGKNEVCWF